MTTEANRAAYQAQITDARLAALERSMNEVRAKAGLPLRQWLRAALGVL